eukprot:gene87-114_t
MALQMLYMGSKCGSGKTPCVEYLLSLLQNRFPTAVISRGYKRETHGCKLVTHLDDVRTIGDEPYQLYRKFAAHNQVVVAEDRVQAMQQLMASHPLTKVILLDDGFQHRRIERHLNILLTSYHRPFWEDDLLPLGRLREPKVSARRADVILVTKCPQGLTHIEQEALKKRLLPYCKQPTPPIFFSYIRYESPISLYPEHTHDFSIQVVLLTGIADPTPLVQHVRSTYQLVHHIAFADHHSFTEKDIQKIIMTFHKVPYEKKCILTTEKDGMRLMKPNLIPRLGQVPIFLLPMSMELLGGASDFKQLILRWFNKLQAHITEQEKEFLDDSTQEVHGLHTTFYLTTAGLKSPDARLTSSILTAHKMDAFTFRQKMAYRVQDLGNDGTATKSLWYVLPPEIGIQSGFYAYNVYFNDPTQQPYYDTKAPYTDGSVTFGNYGSYLFKVCHARSFNRQWHLGALFETIITDREYIPDRIPFDRQVLTYPFTLFGHYKTAHNKYQLLFSFYRKNHRMRDTGGISGNGDMRTWLEAKADIKNNLPYNDQVEHGELRQQYYLYQQFAPKTELQLYHEIKRSNRFNYFRAKKLSTDARLFLSGHTTGTSQQIEDMDLFQETANEFGIKGQAHRVFYRYYYKLKQLEFEKNNQSQAKFTEHYLGLSTRINLKDNAHFLYLDGEYLHHDLYKIHAAYKNPFFELIYHQTKYQPTYLACHCDRLYRKWDNAFSPPTSKQLQGALKLSLPWLLVRPYSSWQRVKAPIYFKHAAVNQPISSLIAHCQEQGHADMLALGTNLNLSLWSYFHLDTDLTYTTIKGPAAHAFKIPTWYTQVRTYFAKDYYDGKSAIETGVELNWKSSYYADGYDSITQQFYRQDHFEILAYPIIELFFNFKIKTFRGFVKFIHVNQGMLPQFGYFMTPFYPGQLRSIDFGFGWSLFD